MTGWSTFVPAASEAAQSRPTRRDAWWRGIDWVLVLAVLTLMVLGTLLVWSATRTAHGGAYLKKDLLFVPVAVAIGALVAVLDYRTLRAYVPVVYLLGLLGLVAVLAIGSDVNGAKAWIRLGGGFEVQPAEFAKVALVVGGAMLLSERRDAELLPTGRDIWQLLGLTAVPLGLIMLQPDFGTAMVISATVFGMLAVSGASWRWLVGLVVLGAGGAVLAYRLGIVHSYQIQRFTTFLNPDSRLGQAGYQSHQARLAIGSGGFWGTGLFHGPQTNGGFVPEQQTDFVFTVAGEELGFVGATAIVAIFGLILWRGLRIARDATEAYGRLVAIGVVCWFTAQGFENLGMAMGIMPMTGIPLPFISYGGSSLIACAIGAGLLLNVYRASRQEATPESGARALSLV